jgi:hypothetical protein
MFTVTCVRGRGVPVLSRHTPPGLTSPGNDGELVTVVYHNQLLRHKPHKCFSCDLSIQHSPSLQLGHFALHVFMSLHLR